MPTSSNKVAVIGAGSWGTALAKVLADKGDEVLLWARRPELADQINASRENERYLAGARLPSSLAATHSIERALDGASMVVFVAPSHATRDVARLAAPF